jgi:hypothetical protein
MAICPACKKKYKSGLILCPDCIEKHSITGNCPICGTHNGSQSTIICINCLKKIRSKSISKGRTANPKIKTHRCKYCGRNVQSNIPNELCDTCKKLFGHTYYDEL